MEYLIGWLILFGEIWQEVGFIFIRKKRFHSSMKCRVEFYVNLLQAVDTLQNEQRQINHFISFPVVWLSFWVPPFKMYLLIVFPFFVNSLWGFLLVFWSFTFSLPVLSFTDQFFITSLKFQNRYSSYMQYDEKFLISCITWFLSCTLDWHCFGPSPIKSD